MTNPSFLSPKRLKTGSPCYIDSNSQYIGIKHRIKVLYQQVYHRRSILTRLYHMFTIHSFHPLNPIMNKIDKKYLTVVIIPLFV